VTGSVLECIRIRFRLRTFEPKFQKIFTFCMFGDVFRGFSCSEIAVQESVFQCYALLIDRDTSIEKEKALRVPRAVNIG